MIGIFRSKKTLIFRFWKKKKLTHLSKIWNQLKDLALAENKQIFPIAAHSKAEWWEEMGSSYRELKRLEEWAVTVCEGNLERYFPTLILKWDYKMHSHNSKGWNEGLL